MKETKKISLAEATHIVRDEGNDSPKMETLIGATINIIGTDLVVEFIKKANGGYTLLLIPTKVNEAQAPKRTLQEMINAINKLFGSGTKIQTEELEKKLEVKNLENVTISLVMAFLYIKKDGDKEKELEYAFQVKCDGLSNLFPKGLETFVEFKNIQLAIWNTENPKIIDAMGLIKPEDYITQLGL